MTSRSVGLMGLREARCYARYFVIPELWTANQTLQRTPESLAVLAGVGEGAAELVVRCHEIEL
jgi:hypothetical protein